MRGEREGLHAAYDVHRKAVSSGTYVHRPETGARRLRSFKKFSQTEQNAT